MPAWRSSVLVLLLAAATAARADDGFWAERSQGQRHDELVARGRAYLETGNAAAAAQLLQQVVARDEPDADAFYVLGVAYYRLRAWAPCADALDHVARLDPGYVARASKGAPQAPTVDDVLGQCLALAGRLDAAVSHYRRLLAAGSGGNASLDTLHEILGDCYLALGRLDEAIDEYLAGLAQNDRRAALWFALAVAYDRDERVERARDAMERALRIDAPLTEISGPGNLFIPPADADYYQALAHELASGPGHRGLAVAWFREYLADMPRGPWVARARSHLAALGPGGVEVTFLPPEAPDGPAVARAIAATAGELAACVAPGSSVVVRALLSIPPAGRGGRTPATASLASIGPAASLGETMDCIEKKLMALRLPVRQLTRATVVIGGR